MAEDVEVLGTCADCGREGELTEGCCTKLVCKNGCLLECHNGHGIYGYKRENPLTLCCVCDEYFETQKEEKKYTHIVVQCTGIGSRCVMERNGFKVLREFSYGPEVFASAVCCGTSNWF
jgi:hypothetical protein